jgi:hypothetical protein
MHVAVQTIFLVALPQRDGSIGVVCPYLELSGMECSHFQI